MAPQHVLVDGTRPIARVVLDRPERRNALSLDLIDELIDAFGGLADAHVVVLGANGPVFSAGHDIAEMTERASSKYFDELFGRCVDLMGVIRALPAPVIARVHGVATAAGCQLVAACDLAVASDDARFATPGVDIGLFCSTPMVPITRAIGRKRALEMLLTGEMIDASTAADWGLVNRVVPADRLDAEVDALATTIASKSATVVALGKHAFYDQDGRLEADAYDVVTPVMVENALLDDAKEGMTAFLEKRPPTWP